MKLKCGHKRRVVIVGPLNSVLHRSDGSRCPDNFPNIGNSVVDTTDLRSDIPVYDRKTSQLIRFIEKK